MNNNGVPLRLDRVTRIYKQAGRELVVFRDVIPAPSVVLVNREQIIEELRRLAHRVQP